MQIHAIRLSNLNSLRGPVVLDFEQPPLAHTGLFAITGDTGAGKTTLLDAITLALFGRTSREHEQEVMSFGCTDAVAEVDFSNENGRFLAHWDQRLTRRKKDPLTTYRSLSKRLGDAWQVVASSPRELDGTKDQKGAVERHLGLNYEQFRRTVLLAQGDFAAFLLADDKNRAAVLERLTDTEIYSRLSKAAHLRARAEGDVLKQLQLERNAQQLLDADELVHLEKRLAESQTQSVEQGERVTQLREHRDWLARLDTLQQQLADLATATTALADERLNQAVQAARLARHRLALPLRPQVERWRDAAAEHTRLVTEQALLVEKKPVLTAQAAAAATLLDAKKAQLTAAEAALATAEPLIETAQRLDEQVAAHTRSAIRAREEANALAQKNTALQHDFATRQTAFDHLVTTLVSTTQWLNEHAADAALDRVIDLVETRHRPVLAEIFLTQTRLRGTLEQREPHRAAAQQQVATRQQVAQQAAEAEAQARHAWQQLLQESPVATLHRAENQDIVLAALAARADNLATFARHSAEYRQLLADLGAARERQTHLSAAAETTLKLLLEIQDELPLAHAAVALKQARHERERSILNLERERAALVAGEPCPLCGATHHPFVTEGQLMAFSDDAEREWQRAQQHLVELQKRETQLVAEFRELGRNLRQLETDFGDTLDYQTDELLRPQHAAEHTLAQLALQTFDGAPVTFQAELLLEQLNAARTEHATAQRLVKQINDAALLRSEAAAALAQAEAEVRLLANEVDSLRQQLADADAQALKAKSEVDDLLAPYGIDFQPNATFKTAFEQLKQQRDAYAAQVRQRDEAQRAQELAHSELAQLATQLQEKNADLERLAAHAHAEEQLLADLRAERLATFGDRDPVAERNTLRVAVAQLRDEAAAAATAERDAREALSLLGENAQSLAQQLASVQARLAELERGLVLPAGLVDASPTGATPVEVVLAALLPDEEAAALEQSALELDRRQTSLEAQQQRAAADLAAEQQRTFPARTAAEVAADLSESEVVWQATQREIGALQQQLDEQARRAKVAQVLMQKIDKQQVEYNRWEQLREMIGSSDGSVFRLYVQSLTLSRLLQHANQHLARLQGGRYRLRKRPSDAGSSREHLELDIVDTFQADSVRSVRTLSGGESFLTSLALALGLADMTARKTRLRTLFIDEGFGTLDESTLEVAVSTLESLQAQGTTIGVISHIKEMKERIATQVRVLRRSDGFSEVEVV